MARKPDSAKSRKVQPSLHPQMHQYLEEMVELGYGSTPTDVAKFLIQQGIHELLKTGLVGPGLKRRNRKTDR